MEERKRGIEIARREREVREKEMMRRRERRAVVCERLDEWDARGEFMLTEMEGLGHLELGARRAN